MLRRIGLVCLMSAALASFAPGASAEEPYGPLRKLGRGVANIGFGVCEVPLQAYDVNQAEGAIACYTYGIFKGLGFFIARECVGVFELVTFPMPLPGMTESPYEGGWGYGPIIEPEWIFDTEHNPYNLIYQDFPAQ